MFIKFDFKCPHCGHVETRFVKKSEMDDQKCEQRGFPSHDDGECLPMLRLPAGTRTTFRFADTKLKD